MTFAQRCVLALLVGTVVACGSSESMPPYPYAVPKGRDDRTVQVEIVGAMNGHVLQAQSPNGVAFVVRLADVMAPFPRQPWGSNATTALRDLAQGKHALLRPYEHVLEAGKMTVVGRVYVDGRDLAWEMVGSGNAWVWEAKSKDQKLKELQNWAKAKRKGLWSLPEAERIPPWKFLWRET